MNGPIGHALVLVALAAAAFGAVAGIGGGFRRSVRAARLARASVFVFAGAMVLANGVMVRALLGPDFSVHYVAQVGSRATPTVFKVVSLWSALEGSILFWGLVLSVYLVAFAVVHRDEHRDYMSFALGVILAVGAFFAFLLAGPADPFRPVFPVPDDGPGPNALLQNHYLMIIHPPVLYLGYVGMTVPFGVAMAALLRGKLADAWMGPLRRWTMVAWTFLSVGILLGAWWAYAVLGWGGYWAWDPVENASFLPWLTGTAFIHSTVVQERRGMLKVWTLTLALATFLLTLLGTFMTRSGVFNSVHSFTQSAIGPAFLGFIALCLAASVGLLAGRSGLLVSERRITSFASREMAFLGNNLLFVAFTLTVLLGTTYPLITEALTDVKVSVGEPYFNKMTTPIALALIFLMGVGPSLPWGEPDAAVVRRVLAGPTIFGAAVAGACALFGLRGILPLATFSLAGFAVYVAAREYLVPARRRISERREPPRAAMARVFARGRRRYGGYLVHLAVAAIAVAIAASKEFQEFRQATLAPGETLSVGDYRVTLRRVEETQEPHRRRARAHLDVHGPGGFFTTLAPGINYYAGTRDPIGTPDIHSNPRRDVYLSLMAYEKDGSSATLKAWIFPLVGWIWGSIPILVFGSLLALWPVRRALARESVSVQAAAGAAVGPR